MSSITAARRGRFAPTPSGPLHLGSLSTAAASWLAARRTGGAWLLRIDDLDGPRCVPGAEDAIRRQLEAHGLQWDGEPVRQSEHVGSYTAGLDALARQGRLYACTCTRARLTVESRAGPDGPVYSGRCRARSLALDTANATLRFRCDTAPVEWSDGVQGRVRRDPPTESGDFVVRRADGQIGYHLACALDEGRMGITDVVRGADLIGATVQQLQLMSALTLSAPRYTHVPVVVGADGRKLSKQNGAPALATDATSAARQLGVCLHGLGYALPRSIGAEDPGTLLRRALSAPVPDLAHRRATPTASLP